jgi:glycosyltransferase involved in cell wall biosynthesis
MNVLFLTLVSFDSFNNRNIYTDLLREFIKNGHQVYAISPVERRQNQESYLIKEENATILRLQIGNTQKTNIIEKGISTLLIKPQFKAGIKKYFSDVKFDLILYSTPPITLVSAIEYVKKRDGARTYLLLKDIFPQNAVDIGMMSTSGVKGLLYKHFRRQEKSLYAISDTIGCMSPANVEYLLSHNPEVKKRDDEAKRNGKWVVEVCPNSMEVVDKSVDEGTRRQIREKYNIPQDKTVFVYGGNLGKPQGIPFLIECLKKCEGIDGVYFLIVGDGTEYGVLESYVEGEKPRNVRLMKRLPRDDYDAMVGACDVGLLFLDHRFTIPNFPSRLLSYMQAKLPVLACTDSNTDIGKVITEGGFGWWCESDDADEFLQTITDICTRSLIEPGATGYEYLMAHYSAYGNYEIINKTIGGK